MSKPRQNEGPSLDLFEPRAEAPGPLEFLRHPAFSHLDRHFALFMARLSAPAPEELALAAALVSRSRGQGHVCLELRRAADTLLSDRRPGEALLELPEAASWTRLLKKCVVVGEPGEFKPLILDPQGRIYLHRYWQYEFDLAAAIRQRVADGSAPPDPGWLSEILQRYFPRRDGSEIDWQKVACFTALTKRLCVISGGPGTGKTRTVAMLLAMLLEQAGQQPLRIALAAPTGKAAARLQESIKQARAALPCPAAILDRLPDRAATVHRLLGMIPHAASFRHNAENPLPYDVLVIDEASMVDLALMAKFFEAVPPSARVILLGDKDQLASVEAGEVLAAFCASERINGFSAGVRATYRRVTGEDLPSAESDGLGDGIVQLHKNYRFGPDNGILALSQAVNAGNAGQALQILHERGHEAHGIGTSALPGPDRLKAALRRPVVAGFAAVLTAPDARTALAALGRFRILCALRHGPFGVENVNRLVEEILREEGLLASRERRYEGRPIMVLRNDYPLRLFNGDVGIIRRDPESGQPRACFLEASQELRGVAPPRLPEHETVFAMTVHKAQGSEFDEVLFILPDRESPVLTRELVYTGITRASRRVELWFDEPVLRTAIARRVERASGLRDQLWGRATPPKRQE